MRGEGNLGQRWHMATATHTQGREGGQVLCRPVSSCAHPSPSQALGEKPCLSLVCCASAPRLAKDPTNHLPGKAKPPDDLFILF